jgi:hypothetical protein
MPTKIIDSDILISSIEFWRKVFEADEVVIYFEKQDKTMRTMRCTLNFKKIPVKDQPKNVDINKIIKLIKKTKMFHVFDLDKKAWRTVPYEKVEWADIDKKRHYGPQSRRFKEI